MKKVIGLTIAVLLSVSMLSTGAWAFWADTESSVNNQLTAGTLDMVPTTSGTGPAGKYTVTAGGNEVNGKVVFQKLLPGDSGTITWLLTNNGSLPGTLTLPSTVTFAENGSNEIEAAVPGNNHGGFGDLDLYLGVRVKRNGTYFLGVSDYVPFSGLQTALNAESNALVASGTITYVLEWSIANPLAVNNNIIQSDSAQIDITFTLNQ